MNCCCLCLLLLCATTLAHVRMPEQRRLTLTPNLDHSDEEGDGGRSPWRPYRNLSSTPATRNYSTGRPMTWLRSSDYNPLPHNDTAHNNNSAQEFTMTNHSNGNATLQHFDAQQMWTNSWNNSRHSNFSSSNNSYCEPEVFQHDYVIAENRTEPATNRWKRAKPGERAGLHEVCLKPNGLPLTRRCRYNVQLQRAEWEDISCWPRVACIRQPRQCLLSSKLNTLHEELLGTAHVNRSTAERGVVTTQLYEMLHDTNYRLLPADVHFTTQILREVTANTQDAALSEDVMSICDHLMASNTQVLRISADLNATNSLLDTFESYMDAVSAAQVPSQRCGATVSSSLVASPSASASDATQRSYKHGAVETVRLEHIGVSAQLSANVSVFYVNPRCANVSGIAVYAASSGERATTTSKHAMYFASLAQFRYRFVYMNESVEALMVEPELELASFVPTRLWNRVSASVLRAKPEAVLVLKVYAHDGLFVESALVRTRKPFSKVLSISLPGFEGTFPEELPFLLRNHYANVNASQAQLDGTGCGYWDYNTWVSSGVHTDVSNLLRQPVIRCDTQHLTQFSFLLGGSYRQSDVTGDVLITPLHMRVLDIISLVGCSLSLLGLLGIWLTAALCKNWRALASTKVLLNLCLALTLQMFLFVFVNTDDMSEHLVEHKNYADCVALGATLQYSILVLFTWMLIVALLQFQRYVTIIGIERPRHYILKSAILAWGLPLIPTLLVVCIAPKSYIPTDYQLQTDTGICYPSGLSLTLGVIMPVTVIVMANLGIFVYVFYSISHSLSQAMHRHEKQMVVKQIRLSVLLFFLLGISWIFGIFAYMGASTVFSYLFCLTATLQGFVLFIYFVVLDEMTRNAWLQLCCPKRLQKSSKRSTELQSMTTTSTGLESASGVGVGAGRASVVSAADARSVRDTATHHHHHQHNGMNT